MEVGICSPESLTAVLGYMYGFNVPWQLSDQRELLALADLFQLDFIKAQAALKLAHDGHFTEANCLLICQVFSPFTKSKWTEVMQPTFQELEKLGMSADNLRLKAAKYLMEEMSNIDWKQMSRLDQLMDHFWQEAKEARMVRLRIKWKDNIGRL